MIFLLTFLFVLCDASPGYSGSSNSGNDLSQGTATSAGAGSYAGGFSGGAFPPGNGPPFVPFVPTLDFSAFFEQLNRQHQEFIQQLGDGIGVGSFSYSQSSGPSASTSRASIKSLVSGGIQTLAQGQGQTAGHQNPAAQGGGSFDIGNRGGFVGGYGGGFTGPQGSYSFSGPLDGAAYASGSIGPGGVHQTAAVYPENPSAPNVNTRFGAENSETGGGGDGFKSVFTSSKSVSANVDGKPQTFREASTTVNDNGKITTYTARNP